MTNTTISAGRENGRPVLFLDGAPPFPENGVALTKALGARNCRATYFTYRGYDGQPGYSPETIFTDITTDVVRWISAQSMPVFVVGYSFGGHVALKAALSTPARVSGLLLLGGFASVTEQIRHSRLQVADAIAAGVDLTPALPQFLSPRAQQTPRVMESCRKWLTTFDPVTTPPFLASLRHLTSIAHELPRLRIPVTQRVGALDDDFGGSVTDELQHNLPNFNLQRVAETGHLLALEDFEGTVDAIVTAAT